MPAQKLLQHLCTTLEEQFHDLNVHIRKSIHIFSCSVTIPEEDDTTFVLGQQFKDILVRKMNEIKVEFGTCISKSLLEIELQLSILSDKYKTFEVELERYFEEKVQVNQEAMKVAEDTLWKFIHTLESYLATQWPSYPFGKITLSGSVADGTKVCLPNEFDINLPIYLPDKRYVQYEQTANHLLKVNIDGNLYFRNNYWLDLNETEKHANDNNTRSFPVNRCLSPELISKHIKKLLTAFKNDKEVREELLKEKIHLDFARSEHFYKFGPAIDILVIFEGPFGKGSFVVDLVPCIQEKIDNEYVINPYYTQFVFSAGGYGGSYVEMFADPTVYWRRSHTKLEHQLFQLLGSKLQKPLMIWKCIVLQNTGLKNPILNSFHLKNIALLLAFQNIDEIANQWNGNPNETLDIKEHHLQKWASYPLGLQVVLFARRLYKFLIKGSMHGASEPNVDVNFDSRNEEINKKHDLGKLKESLCCYLADILKTQDWCKLISDCQLEVNENECPFSRKKI